VQGFFWLVNLFVSGIDFKMIMLIPSDFINSLGAVTGDQLSTNSVHSGPLCTAQAAMLQIGATASACWSFAIAAYTFILLAGGPHWRAWAVEKSTSGKARWVLCIGIWFGVFFLGIIAPVIIQHLNPDKPPFCMILLPYI
jgi:heme/copper-type cytochrome/quinol oxidase subunit 3